MATVNLSKDGELDDWPGLKQVFTENGFVHKVEFLPDNSQYLRKIVLFIIKIHFSSWNDAAGVY